MRPQRFLAVLVLVTLAAAGLRLAHLASLQGTAYWDFDHAWASSDMYSNRAWAEHVATDWLDRNAYRPTFSWMAAVADEATWSRWFGPATYYQPPLYTYLLAMSVKIAGSAGAFRWAQALLGALNVLLIGLLGRRAAGPWGGILAALFACGYAPFILYDGELLRGTLVLTLNLLALLAMYRAGERSDPADPRKERRAFLLAGAALGASFLADSGIVTFLPLAFLWAAAAGPGGPASSRARRAGWLAAGLLIALAPLLLRNAIAGAPLLSTTTRAPLAFVMGNAPDAIPVGASIPQSTADILHASDYGTFATIRETIRAHDGNLAGLLGMQWRKLVGLFDSYEVPDNPSFYYASLLSPILRFGLRFSCLSGLGLVGLLLAARRWREHLILLLYLAGVLSLFLFAHVVSRYRQPLVIPLAVFAASAIVAAFEAARARKVAVAAGILLGGVALSFALPDRPPAGYRYYRGAEFLVAAGKWEEEGDLTRAAAEIRRAFTLADAENAPKEERLSLGLALAELYQRHERYPEALAAYRDVLDDDPRNAAGLAGAGAVWQEMNKPMEALQTLMRAADVDPDNPEVHARLGYLYWVVFHDGEKAMPEIRRALDLEPNSPVAPKLSRMAAEIAAKTGLSP